MPDWKEEIRKRLLSVRLSPTREAEIVEELAQHLDDRYQQSLTGGATEEQAYQTVLLELAEYGFADVSTISTVLPGANDRDLETALTFLVTGGLSRADHHPGARLSS